ncbi:MAG: hypothetical protein KIT58_00180 [Planctomycetota bacterium]|nr:hypothetical protein [Planctomycetota bacterium]
MIWTPLEDEVAAGALARELRAWDGTPYMPGQQRQGVGVDCVRFVAGVLDELTGRQTPIRTLPPDASMHDVARADEKARELVALYGAAPVDDGTLEPGDVVITGPRRGGAGHAAIVGDERGVVWHATRPFVHRAGLRGIYALGHRIWRVYRLRDRAWGRT